ncbi:hypothetical protein RJT34_00714 [Clitoria ternatea]|uniref:Poly(A) RNA polymerase mitochondrial-like central palm domain-containing protein n=1 Tax=Clitoria ternatea TaxID=43366 RepID=A0AAN9Q0T8_CLITE
MNEHFASFHSDAGSLDLFKANSERIELLLKKYINIDVIIFSHDRASSPLFSLHTASSLCFHAMMESRDNELAKMAMKLEFDMLSKIKFTPARIVDLDGLLCDIFVRQCPKPIDYLNRRDLIRIFNIITKEIYGNGDDSPVVEEYGSFVMDMFNVKSDLDLSINFKNSMEVPRRKKISTLRTFNQKLNMIQRKGHVTGLQSILTARVPIIKVTDSGTGIECDLSVDNRDGIAKSHIFRAISNIDDRFRKLTLLMKSWAKAHNINSPKDHTLSSLAIVSFVAFHLQTCNPPILPPFSVLLKDGGDPISVAKNVRSYLNYGKQNKESLAKLFITLFVKLASVEKLWQNGICVGLYEGSWIFKSWKRLYAISVEDFIDRSQNVARAVGTTQVKAIYGCIHKSLDYLLQFLDGQGQGNNLVDVLFEKQAVSTLGVEISSNTRENKRNHRTSQNPCPPKKRRVSEALVKNQVQKPSEKKIAQGLHGIQPHDVGRMPQAVGETGHNVHAPFTPRVSHSPSLAIPSSNAHVIHSSSSQGIIPSRFLLNPVAMVNHSSSSLGILPSRFPLNPVAFDGSYNPADKSHLVSSQTSLGFVKNFHHQAVAPHPYIGSIHSRLPEINHHQYRDHTLYNQRNDQFRS